MNEIKLAFLPGPFDSEQLSTGQNPMTPCGAPGYDNE